MINNNYWLYIEPYVHIFYDANNFILYNSLNGKHISTTRALKKIFNIVQKIVDEKNLYVTSINSDDLENNEVLNFINEIKEYYFGDLLLKKWSDKKPIQLIPILYIDKEIINNKNNPEINELDNLDEMSINLCSGVENSINRFQFIFCENDFEIKQELDIKLIKNLLRDTKVINLNVFGNNIFRYTNFNELVEILHDKKKNTTFYINYQNPDITVNNVNKLKDLNSQICLSVSSPINKQAIEKAINIVKESGIIFSFDFKVESDADAKVFEQIVYEYRIKDFQFLPYYNGQNINLFEDNVFLTINDIFESKPTQNDILARQAINQLNFGKLYILPNADVYANLNHQKLGNLNENTIHEIIYKELYSNNSWRLLRKEVEPCKNCIYNLLCPPISDYELSIGKYNLCHVWEE